MKDGSSQYQERQELAFSARPADPSGSPPLRESPSDEPRPARRETGGREHAAVLIVDDDPGVREVLAMLLADEGYHVATACNGREALSYLAHHEAPALILLDIMMPGMDGHAFRVIQRERPALAAIPVVVLSAGENSELVTAMRPAAFLKKPFDLDALLALVEKYCGERPPR
jgi:CheY-like chemotaxis protein